MSENYEPPPQNIHTKTLAWSRVCWAFSLLKVIHVSQIKNPIFCVSHWLSQFNFQDNSLWKVLLPSSHSREKGAMTSSIGQIWINPYILPLTCSYLQRALNPLDPASQPICPVPPCVKSFNHFPTHLKKSSLGKLQTPQEAYRIIFQWSCYVFLEAASWKTA